MTEIERLKAELEAARADESVRRATRDLEKAIMAKLAARGLAPLVQYRREVAE